MDKNCINTSYVISTDNSQRRSASRVPEDTYHPFSSQPVYNKCIHRSVLGYNN